MAPTPALALHGLWWVVSEPPLTPLDQNFALRHASIIHPALTPQGNRYWVTFRVFRVTGLQVIGADRDRNRLALSGFYDGQTVRLDFGHIDRVLSARVATGFLAPAHGLGRDLPAARHGAPAASPFSASRAPLRLVDGLPRELAFLLVLVGLSGIAATALLAILFLH